MTRHADYARLRGALTACDLEDVADGAELLLAPGTLVTPLAAEEAARRSIRIRADAAARPAEEPPPSPAHEVFTVAVGADHGGFELKQQLIVHLREWGYGVLDLGTTGSGAVDYPDFAEAVAAAVARGQARRGIVVDSAGIGSAIAANKVPGVRAAPCYDLATARNSREHNDANVLALGAKLTPPETAREIAALWLRAAFAGGRHQRRVDKIAAIEQRHAGHARGAPCSCCQKDG